MHLHSDAARPAARWVALLVLLAAGALGSCASLSSKPVPASKSTASKSTAGKATGGKATGDKATAAGKTTAGQTTAATKPGKPPSKGPSWTAPKPVSHDEGTTAASRFAWDPDHDERDLGTRRDPDPGDDPDDLADDPADDAGDETSTDEMASEDEAGDDAATDDAETVQAEEVEPDESAEPSQAPVQDLAVQHPELSPDEVRKERILAEEPEITYDIPMSYNEKVLAWVDFYAHRHRDRFQPGLERSGRYLPMIRRIFAEEGIPLDLAYIAHVESAYKPNALSRARAKGIFQFMAPTGRQYGLKQDYWIDERSDPEKATRAAARYLRNLYGMFGDWYLAMAAYNAGEGRISRALRATGATDFWSLALTSRIRHETKNYVPAILAATLISKNPAKYGFDFQLEAPLDYDTIDVTGAADLRVLAKAAGTDPETLRGLNPALRRHQTPPDRVTQVRVPKGSGESALAALAEIPPSQRVIVVYHRVRPGDTLSRVASRYGTSMSAIQRENRMGRRTMLRAGSTLRIPSGGGSFAPWPDETGTTTARSSHTGSKGKLVVHRVRRGDTLSGVARRYGTTLSAVASLNGFSTKRELRVGERVKVVPGARSAEAARRASGARGTAVASSKRSSSKAVHTVRSGETLWKIATRYRMTVNDLCELNDIGVGSTLHPGMRLTVR